MTPDALRETLAALGWTTGGLAAFLGCDVDRVRNWIRPTGYRVPPNVAAWLLRRVALHERAMRDDPPPGS
jgi:hypothetical protein